MAPLTSGLPASEPAKSIRRLRLYCTNLSTLDSSMATSSPNTSLLVTATGNSSCSNSKNSRPDPSVIPEDLLSFDDVVCSSPTIPTQFPTTSSASTLPASDIRQQGNLILHLNVSPPATSPTSERNIEAELRDIVDNLLQKKIDTQRTLADENTSLRAEISALKHALLLASSQPGSETASVISALEQERTLRRNAEDLQAATGKYLAEQVDSLSRQKLLLEAELRDRTHGHEFWKLKAIATLERCEALEAENLQVKTQLNALARKQSGTVAEQVSHVLREVAEERDRLRQLEEIEQPLAQRTCSKTRRRWVS